MNVARPPGGFHITVVDTVSKYISAESVLNFRITQCWSDLLERIKITALKEGTPIESKGALRFTFIADGAPDYQIPTIQIVYECAGVGLKITNALVWNDADHDEDEEDDSSDGR